MPSLHWATGTQTNVDTVPSYAPRNPSEFANVTRDRAYSNAAPSEFTMALSALRAAASVRRARLMRCSGLRFSQAGSSRFKSGNSLWNMDRSGRPPLSSSEVSRAISTVSSTNLSVRDSERSDVCEVAVRFPTKTRRSKLREIASFSVSISPIRTLTENVSSSRSITSAAEAPLLFARLMTRSAICFSSCIILYEFSLFRAADRDLANLDRRKTHADGNRLSILAADSDAVVQLEIISHCCYLSQHGRPVADQCCTLDWSCDPATLDEICLAGRKNEFAAGDVDLAAAKVYGVKTFFHGLDNVFRGRFPGHHECVRHAWHRNVVITLPAAVSGQR